MIFPPRVFSKELPGSATGAQVITGKNPSQGPMSHFRAEMTQKFSNPPSAHD